jgi:hypothetical protein
MVRRSILRACVAASALLAAPASAEKPFYFLLSPPELVQLRAKEGRHSNRMVWEDRENRGALFRVIRHIAGRLAGKHVDERPPLMEVFYENMSGPPDALVVERDRFLVGAACRPHFCPAGAAIIIDLKTGHAAFAITHSFEYVEGLGFTKNGAVTQVMKSCANDELRLFADEWFRHWVEREREVAAGEYRIGTLTTPCTSSPPPRLKWKRRRVREDGWVR